jgi:hypothetical protein
MIADPFDPSQNIIYREPAPTPGKVEGLPTTGAMGKQPAVTVAGVMALLSIIIALIVQFTGVQVPPDLQQFGNEHGAVAVGLAIAAYQFIQGHIIKGRVFAPASLATRYIRKPGI